jgi:CubicO group peptidase (beta-lactamase class C family)
MADVRLHRIDRFIEERRAETRLPGCGPALAADGQQVYARGYGIRDLERAGQ